MIKNTEPQLLSIEAIIQKSEFNRPENEFASNFKKNVIDELVSKDLQERKAYKFSQLKNQHNFLPSKTSLQSLRSYSVHHRKQKGFNHHKYERQKRIVSLNSSKKINQPGKSRNQSDSSRVAPKNKIKHKSHRPSLCETGNKGPITELWKQTQLIDIPNQYLSPKNIENHAQHIQPMSHMKQKMLSRFQFQIPIAKGEPSKIRQSLSNKLLQGQIISKNQNQSINQSNKDKSNNTEAKRKRTIMTEEEECINFEVTQQRSEQEDQNEQLLESDDMSFENEGKRKNKKILAAKSPVIPGFIIEVVSKQHKNPINPPKNFEADFKASTIDPNQTFKERVVKESGNIAAMKRKMSYKHKKSSESTLEPQANLMRLLSKEQRIQLKRIPGNMTSRKQISKAKESRKSVTKKEGRKKKNHIEQNVCGWEVQDQPMFFDNY